jgi:hypothetical protein
MGRCFLGGGGVRGYFCPSTVLAQRWFVLSSSPLTGLATATAPNAFVDNVAPVQESRWKWSVDTPLAHTRRFFTLV